MLNTCDPYIIKYPSPFLETSNSPIITPISDMLILTFNVFIILSLLQGSITLKNICILFALKLRSSVI